MIWLFDQGRRETIGLFAGRVVHVEFSNSRCRNFSDIQSHKEIDRSGEGFGVNAAASDQGCIVTEAISDRGFLVTISDRGFLVTISDRAHMTRIYFKQVFGCSGSHVFGQGLCRTRQIWVFGAHLRVSGHPCTNIVLLDFFNLIYKFKTVISAVGIVANARDCTEEIFRDKQTSLEI